VDDESAHSHIQDLCFLNMWQGNDTVANEYFQNNTKTGQNTCITDLISII
jgi:hypothetical protein